jgi:deoxyribodipyrimidine photo-lyase
MQRAQRGLDNPALNVAIDAANALSLPLAVFFGLHPGYPGGNLRHYAFLVEGLEETAARVEERGAAFVFRPYPEHDLIRFCSEVRPALVVGDENPLRVPEGWRRSAAQRLTVPLWTVDADVIVPSRLFDRQEYAARTLRPKIHLLLTEYLIPPGNPRVKARWSRRRKPPSRRIEPARLLRELPLDRGAGPVTGFRGGTSRGLELLDRFLAERLDRYHRERNAPHRDGTSELSAYLHFGHLGPHTIALAVAGARAPVAAKEAYLEELIVRRELAINYVWRNPRYDRLAGCPAWARKTLKEQAADPRPERYTERQLEQAETRDPLWNAAQQEMVLSGRMHGYLRMYWAKKILEWTGSPARAFQIAIRLNDRYQLDGRDPNGYTGVAWAIGGTHDRPWPPRKPILGLIRPMTFNGMRRKFDVEAYIQRVALLGGPGSSGAPE